MTDFFEKAHKTADPVQASTFERGSSHGTGCPLPLLAMLSRDIVDHLIRDQDTLVAVNRDRSDCFATLSPRRQTRAMSASS
jgi:hypothetical protein